MRRLASMLGAALLISLGAIAIIGRLGRSWESRVVVAGHSMEPTLFAGDWLLVDADAYRRRPPREGELVVARDPRDGQRLLVKRVVAVSSAEGTIGVSGDHAGHADESDVVGQLRAADLVGRPWFRYWPADRIGPIGPRER